MFIYNMKVNSNGILKIIFGIAILIAILFFGISAYKIFTKSAEVKVEDEMRQTDVYNITASNYTNILKAVHDDLDTYLGQKIQFCGYIYRVSDIQDNQFILARDMIISSNLQTLVVGFLCEYSEINKFEDKVWVQIEGTIEKGEYYGEIPIIKIQKLQQIEKPSEEYVYPPDDTFVPTSALV